MSPFALQVLRKLTRYALALAALLLLLPPALRFLGWLGPSVDDELRSAERALSAAQTYAGTAGGPETGAARAALEQARLEAGRGMAREARRLARQARAQAVAAQRTALAERETRRRAALRVVADVERALAELEAAYEQALRSAPTTERAALVSLMKRTRQAGAELLLAFEQGRSEQVLQTAADTLAALRQARARFESQAPSSAVPRPPR